MKKRELPYCPYCGKNLNYIESMSIKNKGEYQCIACLKYSDVKIDNSAGKLSHICQLISLVSLVLLVLFTPTKSLFCVFIVALPFLFFYSMVPFSVNLKSCKQEDVDKEIKKHTKTAKSKKNTTTKSVPKNKTSNDRQKINSIETTRKRKKETVVSSQTEEVPLYKVSNRKTSVKKKQD